MSMKEFATAICLVTTGLIASAEALCAQQDTQVSPEEFLTAYRDALPKLEKALYRNKHIEVVLVDHTRNVDGSYASVSDKVVFRSNHDRFIVEHEHNDGHNGVQIFRPDHTYLLTRLPNSSYKITLNRELPESISADAVRVPWWGYPSCSTTVGLGHGVTEYEVEWYTSLTNGDIPISKITLINDGGRSAYRIDALKVEKWGNSDLSLHFDKNTLFNVQRKIYQH